MEKKQADVKCKPFHLSANGFRQLVLLDYQNNFMKMVKSMDEIWSLISQKWLYGLVVYIPN